MITALQMSRGPGITFDELKQETLRQIIQKMTYMDVKPDASFKEIKLSCGGHLIIKTMEDFLKLPEKNIPCQCGNLEHYLIRFGFIGE